MATAVEVHNLQRHFGSIRAVNAALIWLDLRTFARASLLARL